MVKFCSENFKVKKCKCFDNKIYCLLPSNNIETTLNIPFAKQLVLLENLQEAKMIKAKFETSGEIYVLVC